MKRLPLCFSILLLTTGLLTAAPEADQYKLGSDSMPKDGVPKGEVKQMPAWTESKVFPGTTRDWWLYIPAQYKPETPANVMVFCDGGGFVKADGNFRVPTVFDNLIAAGEMPVTIGIFLTPGQRGDTFPDDIGTGNPNNRDREYDVLDD